jgi:serine protease Do
MMDMKLVQRYLPTALVLAGLATAPSAAWAKDNSNALDLARQLNQAFIAVAEKVSPSVVVINVAHKVDYSPMNDEDNPFWDWWRRQFEGTPRRDPRRPQRNRPPVFDGQGSGVVLREDGYILTNRHVVDGADKIRVRFKNGKTYDAEVRGVDAQSDVAILKINATGLPVAKLADSDRVKVGEFAVAIGAPFELDYSVTFGHVSAKGRSAIIPDATLDQDFIQTDANINPGNSGGPLVNIEGEVMGINTLIRGLRTGIGFAIPSNLANEVAARLIADGKFTRAWLGVEIRSLAEDVDYRDLVKGVEEGVVVRGIVQDGPAAKSDLKLGDVITTVDGKPVNTAQQLKNQIRGKKLGQPVVLEVVRNGKKLTLKVQPEEWPEDTQPVANRRGGAEPEAESADLGLTVKPVTKELAKEYGIEMAEGLLITAVEPGGLAHRKGVLRGDIITEINQRGVATLKDYREAMKSADTKKGLVLNLISQGVSKFVILKDSGD